jgi:hypothetical protein
LSHSVPRQSTCSLLLLVLLAGCSANQPAQSVVPSYDAYTRRLLRLSADQNGDGRIDQWTYLDGNRALRGEADADGDGRIDRWEYFEADGSVSSIGTSSSNDGIEDTWTSTRATADGEMHVATSTRRDRARDRHAYYKGQTLLRVEEDTNGDGLVDKWDRYDGAVLREVAFDMSFTRGKPDRRALYDSRGRFSGVEIDPDGDGTFVRAPSETERPRGSERNK